MRYVVSTMACLTLMCVCSTAALGDERAVLRNGAFEGNPGCWQVRGDASQYPYLDCDSSQCMYAVLPFANGTLTTLTQKFLFFGEGEQIEIRFRYKLGTAVTLGGGGAGLGPVDPQCPEAAAWMKVTWADGDSTDRISIPLQPTWTDFLMYVGGLPPSGPRLDRDVTDVMGRIEFGTYFCDETPSNCSGTCALKLCIDEVEIRVPTPMDYPEFDKVIINDAECNCRFTMYSHGPLASYSGPDPVPCTQNFSPYLWTWDDDLSVPITSLPYADTDNTNTGEEYLIYERWPCAYREGHWYRVTGNGNELKVSLCPGNLEAEWIFLAVFRRLPDDFNLLEGDASDYTPCVLLGEEIEWCSESGTVYFIFVGSEVPDQSNPYTLVVTDLGSCP